MVDLHRKAGEPRAIAHELASLRALSRAARHGGAPVAQVAAAGRTSLSTHCLIPAAPSASAARAFGRQLAHTHAHAPEGGRVFGEEPPDFPAEFDHRGAMGMAPLPLVAPGSPARSFGEFYAADRLLPYVAQAVANGSLSVGDASVIDRLVERLRDGLFDSPQPALVHTEAALLHGDLWSGNLIWADPTSPLVCAGADSSGAEHQPLLAPGQGVEPLGVLIDPACQGGHAESDLAQLTVFGAPFVEEIYAGYQEASPLADGWRERIGLHQLHMLIVHAALFGSSYGAQTIRTAQLYL